MSRDRQRLVLPVIVAWGAAAAVLVAAPVGVTAPLGLLLVALPGFAWLRAVHPRRLSGLETFVGITAVALGLLVLTALVLNQLPGGLRPASWAIALALLTTSGQAVAAARIDTEPIELRRPARPSARHAVAIALGVCALAGAAAVSIISARTSDKEHFTELSLVPRGASTNATSAVLLITNREDATVRYRLEYVSGRRIIEYKLTLRSGDSFRRVESVRAGAASARLYRDPSSTPYRHVWIGDHQGELLAG